MTLVPLPPQPPATPWPTDAWPEGDARPALTAAVDAAFDGSVPVGETYAAVVVVGGRIVAERYGGAIGHWDRDDEPVGPTTQLLSWSMAKSMLHTVVGTLVAEDRLDPTAPAAVPMWHARGDDARGAITLDHLLEMRDGLDFVEDYVDAGRSDVIEMLFGAGKDDVASFAADRGLAAAPGTRFNYSSGTTNIVSGIVARAVGPGDAYDGLVRRRLFEPIGMTAARATFDAAGTWVASSFVHAPAREFARFGLLHLRGGTWDGREIVPAAWVDHARTHRSSDEEGNGYGAHWWVRAGDPLGTFSCNGYEGQRIVVVPGLDAVVVRLGKTASENYPDLRAWVDRTIAAIAEAH